LNYQFDDNLKLIKASFANYADYIKDQDKWYLYDIRETTFGPQETKSNHVSQYAWDSAIDPQILRVLGVKYLGKLSLSGLRQTIRYRKANGLNAGPYQLAFWKKIVQPIATIVMMFLAIPFIFGPLRNSTMGLKIVSGILVGFCFYTLNGIFGHVSLLYPVHPFWGATLPTIIAFVVGCWMLKKVF